MWSTARQRETNFALNLKESEIKNHYYWSISFLVA